MKTENIYGKNFIEKHNAYLKESLRLTEEGTGNNNGFLSGRILREADNIGDEYQVCANDLSEMYTKKYAGKTIGKYGALNHFENYWHKGEIHISAIFDNDDINKKTISIIELEGLIEPPFAD
jgi:hypothetical protein